MIVYGHRGARFEAPENTVAGFAYARDQGLSAVEFDVRMSADGQLVVIHDAEVDRTTDGHGAVAELAWEELRGFDAAVGYPRWDSRCSIPTLSEVLEEVAGFEHLEIEIKADSAGRDDQLIIRLLKTLTDFVLPEDLVLTSFHPALVRRVREIDPQRAVGLIGNWDCADFLDQALELGAVRADLQHSSSSAAMVRAAHDHGMSVVGWPCNTPGELEKLRDWGVDAVCTDAPQVLADTYERSE